MPRRIRPATRRRTLMRPLRGIPPSWRGPRQASPTSCTRSAARWGRPTRLSSPPPAAPVAPPATLAAAPPPPGLPRWRRSAAPCSASPPPTGCGSLRRQGLPPGRPSTLGSAPEVCTAVPSSPRQRRPLNWGVVLTMAAAAPMILLAAASATMNALTMNPVVRTISKSASCRSRAETAETSAAQMLAMIAASPSVATTRASCATRRTQIGRHAPRLASLGSIPWIQWSSGSHGHARCSVSRSFPRSSASRRC
mmetsp:Transcript_140924/g.366827  ORF Transcript_140924/g.366827 Transcript_140924/m.366827 type:complete len:252 (+) Transcript_140924:493-1248(+)